MRVSIVVFMLRGMLPGIFAGKHSWSAPLGVQIQACGDVIYRSTLDPKLRLEEVGSPRRVPFVHFMGQPRQPTRPEPVATPQRHSDHFFFAACRQTCSRTGVRLSWPSFLLIFP